MTKIEQFRKNVIDTYRKIHGGDEISGFEGHMCFHGTQRPIEFFGAWELIMEKYLPTQKEVSLLEIGAAKGLWSIAFIEFCKLYDKIPSYVTVSLLESISFHEAELEWNRSLVNVKNYYADKYVWHHLDRNSQTEETRDLVSKILPEFDFVFIDGEHSYNGVYQDTKLYKPMAKKLLMYHDIAEHTYGGTVLAAIREHKVELHHKIMCDGTGEGIGIHVIN